MMYHPKCEYCLPSTNSTLEVKSSNTHINYLTMKKVTQVIHITICGSL